MLLLPPKVGVLTAMLVIVSKNARNSSNERISITASIRNFGLAACPATDMLSGQPAARSFAVLEWLGL
jgi:hypothetical protein